MSRNNTIDHLIREKLSRVAPVPPKGDWERLMSRMKQSPHDETGHTEKFDELVRKKTIESAPQGLNAHWDPLLKRLDRIYWRERQILNAKILELTGILLLLLLVDGHFAQRQNHGRAITNHPAPSAQLSKALTRPNLEVPIPQPATLTSNPVTSPYLSARIPMQLGNTAMSMPSQNLFPNLVKLPGSRIAPLSTLALSYLRSISPPVFSMEKPLLEESPVLEQTSLQATAFNPLTASGKILRLQPESFVALSMFGGPDINLVITDASMSKPAGPALSDISIPAYIRYTFGYSGGATLSFGKGRVSMATGMIYTAKQYQARPVFYISGSLSNGFYGEGITNIEHNILTVPIQLRYDVMRRQNWLAYGAIGANSHLVLESNYTIAGENAFRNSDFNPPAYVFDHSGPSSRSVLDLSGSEKGWLQGGGFSGNTFFSTSLSLGLERQFNNGFTFFLQPTYYHTVYHLSRHGIGPDQERIHTLSVHTGVRIRLK